MRWLITTKADADLDELRARLAEVGARLDEDTGSIPMDEGDQVVGALGPDDLDERLTPEGPILGIYPDSEYELYPDVTGC